LAQILIAADGIAQIKPIWFVLPVHCCNFSVPPQPLKRFFKAIFAKIPFDTLPQQA
jgi:hypothetical protein